MAKQPIIRLFLVTAACVFALSCDSAKATPQPLSELLIGTVEAKPGGPGRACDKQAELVDKALAMAADDPASNAFGHCTAACRHALFLERHDSCNTPDATMAVETFCEALGAFGEGLDCETTDDECPPTSNDCTDPSLVLDQCKVPDNDVVCNPTSLLDSDFGTMLWNSTVKQASDGAVSVDLSYDGDYANINGPLSCSIGVFQANFDRLVFETDNGCPTGIITLVNDDGQNPPVECMFDINDDIGGINCPDHVDVDQIETDVGTCFNDLFGVPGAIDPNLSPFDIAFLHYLPPPGTNNDLNGLNHFLTSLAQLASHAPSLICCLFDQFAFADDGNEVTPFSCEDLVDCAVEENYADPENCAGDAPGDACEDNGQAGTCVADNQDVTTCDFFNTVCECVETQGP